MGVYTRFKKDPNGFRNLVELLETTPAIRRQKMIDVGMAEDAEYTERAMKYVITFADVLSLPDDEMAELVNTVSPRSTAFAIAKQPEEVQARIMKCGSRKSATEIREYITSNVELRDIGGGQLKMVEALRKLEKLGLVKTKRIPT